VSATDPAEHGTTETNGTGTFTSNTPTFSQATLQWHAPFEGGSQAILGGFSSIRVGGPGQPADERETKKCPSGYQEYADTGTVDSGTSGDNDIGATFKAEFCVNSTAALILEPGSKMTITESSSS
jgi:hypothetical protein